MNNTRRRILELVAEGRLTPPDAARLLVDPSADEVLALAFNEPVAGAPIERLEVISTGAQVTIVGDESVPDILVDGPHTLRRHDEAAVVEFAGATQPYYQMPQQVVLAGRAPGGLGFNLAATSRTTSQGVPLTIRANPRLPLTVSITSGGLAVEKMEGPIHCQSISSTSSIRDVVGPLTASSNAGSLRVEGWFREGQSHIACAMGSLRVGIRPDADLRLHINEDLGGVKVDLSEDENFHPVEGELGHDPQTQTTYFREWLIGSGQGSLVVNANMARVVIKQSVPEVEVVDETARLTELVEDEVAGVVIFQGDVALLAEGEMVIEPVEPEAIYSGEVEAVPDTTTDSGDDAGTEA